MPSRCLNRVTLIGNLTRDPELRYTPGGMAVISFGMATNRSWTTKQGDKREDAQFHRIVAWNKLAELCSQLLKKGTRVYVAGRLQYREWTTQDGQKKQIAEIVIDDMILLSSTKRAEVYTDGVDAGVGTAEATEVTSGQVEDIIIPDDLGDVVEEIDAKKAEKKEKSKKEDKVEIKEEEGEEIPF
ncbi:single-stranded DNA-binding protein [Candidatus Shapirobacteria bacterium]|nr:MAG: single-stranded DNA-binding protein [Candidatus Shapirobacteria bacterium]